MRSRRNRGRRKRKEEGMRKKKKMTRKVDGQLQVYEFLHEVHRTSLLSPHWFNLTCIHHDIGPTHREYYQSTRYTILARHSYHYTCIYITKYQIKKHHTSTKDQIIIHETCTEYLTSQ